MFGRHGLRVALIISIFLGMLGCTTLRGGVEYDQALRAFKNHDYEMAEGGRRRR